jgi:hypothetical protein
MSEMGTELFLGGFAVVHLQVVLSYVQITGMGGAAARKKAPTDQTPDGQ